MNKNKIIGFNLSLNFVFANDANHKEVVHKIENMIDDLCKDYQDTGAMLLGGKAEFIREDNEQGIKVL